MKRLNPKEERMLKILEEQVNHVKKLKKVGVRVKQSPILDDVNREAGRLARYCTSPNRRLCNEALRLILTRYNPVDVEEFLKKLKSGNYPPEIGVAYLAGGVLALLGRGNGGGIVFKSDGSIDVSPILTGQFTLEHARQVMPLNEPKANGLFNIFKRHH